MLDTNLISQIGDHIRRQPILYRFLLLIIAYNITKKILDTDEYWFPFISNVNFAFHEAGHIFTMTWALDQFVAVSGSIFQCLIPMIFIIIALKSLYFFEASVLGVWLATNLHYLGGYIIDSMRFEWPMSQFFGPNGIHDWNYLLSEWELLDRYEEIGNGVLLTSRIIAIVSLSIAIIFLIWQIFLKIQNRKKSRATDIL